MIKETPQEYARELLDMCYNIPREAREYLAQVKKYHPEVSAEYWAGVMSYLTEGKAS